MINFQAKYFALSSKKTRIKNNLIESHLSLRTYNSINEIDKQFWNNLSNDVFNSWDFILSLEKARVEDSQMKYLIFSNNNDPVGIAVLSSFFVSLDLLSGVFFSKICSKIRKLSPGFMKVRFLFCGTPISIGKNNLKIIDESFKDDILDMLVSEMTVIAKENKITILCLKEFNKSESESLGCLTYKNFIKAPSIPYVKLNTDRTWNSFPGYLKSMRYNYRRQINKSLKKLALDNSSSASVELTDGNNEPKLIIKIPDVNDAAIFYKLYLEVMKRAKNKMEILNKDFFENIFSSMNNNCNLVSLIYKENVLGSALIFKHGDVMTFLLVGLDYSKNKEYDTYFNIVYRIISLAIEKKCKVLEMGQTSYYLKGRCGGYCEEMYFFIKSLNKPLNFLLSIFKPLLFPKIHLDELHVFHS
jgi:predicted N-acyltransferase